MERRKQFTTWALAMAAMWAATASSIAIAKNMFQHPNTWEIVGLYSPAILLALAALLVGVWFKVKTLPEFRPHILPVEYVKAEKRQCCGLYIRNPGYDALDVEIPSTRIGNSAYNLVFHERLAQFGERSGNAFFEAWLESIQGKMLPLRAGCDLHEIMRTSDTQIVYFGITYKDTDFRPYRTNCSIERTNRARNGLEVKAISQEMLTSEQGKTGS